MAEFLTHGNSICAHEVVLEMSKIEDLDWLYDRQPAKYTGIADCGLGFWLPYILDTMRVRTVIIERDVKEVEASIAAMNIPQCNTNFCDVLKVALDACKSHPLVKVVHFDALKEIRIMRQVFWHLMPGEPFDEGRFEQMTDKVIECDATLKFAKAVTTDYCIINEIIPFLKAKTLLC
jgi:hypothetical protein